MQRLFFPEWRYAAAFALGAILWLLAWYWPTAHSIVAIWVRSETFAHGFVIVPISAWMVWRRRNDLASVDVRPDFRVLPLLALVGFGWLLGHLAGAGVVQQFAMVVMIPLLVWAILGIRVVRRIAFPLAFLLLAVPFGEFLERPLMVHTADFTVAALRLSGIPVYREGLFFTLPSGNWSVVEACSGLRYLIAAMTLGCLYAYLSYRSYVRRTIFIVVSLIVPIVANWLRAYMIVMIGHLSSMKLAVGIDHLIYGWLFFGVVMLLLFWAGSYWREDTDGHEPASGTAPPARRYRSSLAGFMAATAAAAVTVAVWPAAAMGLAASDRSSAPALLAPSPSGGWQPVVERITGWRPHFAEPRVQIDQTYAKDEARIGLHIGYYRDQGHGTQLISSQNMLVLSDDREWKSVGESSRTLVAGDQSVPMIEAKLRGRPSYLLVWRFYWVDGQYTVNSYWAKLLQAKSALLGRGDDGAVVIVYASYEDSPDAAKKMQDFADAMLPEITRSLDNAHRIRPRS